MKEKFTWSQHRADVRYFVTSCLLYILRKSVERIPRPLSTDIHATKPNEIIHLYYLYQGESGDEDNQQKYVLMVKYDLSGYCWLKPSSLENAEHIAKILARWNGVFNAPSTWVYDQSSHLKNKVIKNIYRIHHIKHRLTVAYSPLCNGTVE